MARRNMTPILVGIFWFIVTVGAIQYLRNDIENLAAAAVAKALESVQFCRTIKYDVSVTQKCNALSGDAHNIAGQ